MSCVLVTPPQYEPDSGVNPAPYIVFRSADPKFVPALTIPANQKTIFTVTVGDADVDETLTVRFCARRDPDSASILVNSEKTVLPTRDHTPDRLPVATDPFNLCTVFNDTGIHYLYVYVTDGYFPVPGVGCDVAEGSDYANEAWSFTCTDI